MAVTHNVFRYSMSPKGFSIILEARHRCSQPHLAAVFKAGTLNTGFSASMPLDLSLSVTPVFLCVFCFSPVFSPGFLRFVNVLSHLTADERKAFLQFTTGCSSLPPGGLANLYPRLTVVRKVDGNDYSYPSVNTCVHYLKLPEYSSEEILRQRLLAATHEKGFHLN